MARARFRGDIEFSATQAGRFRLLRHHLARTAPRSALAEVVGDVCGMQAQVGSAAQLALRARIRGLLPEDVENAMWRDRVLVKIWCMRGSTHLLPSAELPIFMAGLRRGAARGTRGWFGRYGLGLEELEAMTAAVGAALRGGPRTRRELADRVVAAMGSKARPWVEHGWGGVVAYASQLGLVCFGPNRGQEVTFVRTDEWVPGWSERPMEPAEAELVRRYLGAFGPAGPRDFAAWSGLAVKDVQSIWRRLAKELVPVDWEGRQGWLLAQDVRQIRRQSMAGPPVRLLPSFDAFLLGHRDKDHLVDSRHYKRVYRKAGWLSPVVLADGRVVGIWSYERRGRRLFLKAEAFAPSSAAIRDGLEEEAADVARFFDASEFRVTIT